MAPKKKRRCKICKKYFMPMYDRAIQKQLTCSTKCTIAYYDMQPKKSKRLAKMVAWMAGMRSMGEVRFCYGFLEGNNIDSYEYESDVFEYRVEETRKYTPDFTVTIKPATAKTKGKMIYIEYKGVLDVATRKKMLLVKKQHPTLDIRIVFQRGNNRISKTSKTTYMAWAKQHGFIAADNEVPESWFKK